MRSDNSLQEDLSQARSLIDDLERQNRTSADSNKSLQSRISELQEVKEQQEEEIISLRSRTSLSQQNWAKERDDLASREALAREEFDAARQAMQDWEVLAMEERSLREGLSDRVAELEDQVSSQEDIYARAVAERDTQSTTVDGLQRALQEIQEGTWFPAATLCSSINPVQLANKSSAKSWRARRPKWKSYGTP